MKKVLFSATVLKGHILKFHIPYLKWFKENGFEVWVIARNDTDSKEINIPFCDKYVDLPFSRNPINKDNIVAYKKLKKIIDEEKFSIIHTHTPVGGVLTRLAARNSRKTGCKVIYTAHGFHFYKGSSLINWLIYYPIEKELSKITDVLITINSEDYKLATSKFYAKETYFVNGVGVDFSNRIVNTKDIRSELGFSKDDFVLISVGELNKNKNHKVVIDALKDDELKDIKYIIVGDGKLMNYYKKYIIENKLDDRVKLLGFRNDIFDLLNASDVFVFPSLREGLPVSIMEAMECGLPCIVSNIRGNNDLIIDGENGFLCDNTIESYKEKIKSILINRDLINKFKEKNIYLSKKNSITNVLKEYERVYLKLCGGINNE